MNQYSNLLAHLLAGYLVGALWLWLIRRNNELVKGIPNNLLILLAVIILNGIIVAAWIWIPTGRDVTGYMIFLSVLGSIFHAGYMRGVRRK